MNLKPELIKFLQRLPVGRYSDFWCINLVSPGRGKNEVKLCLMNLKPQLI